MTDWEQVLGPVGHDLNVALSVLRRVPAELLEAEIDKAERWREREPVADSANYRERAADVARDLKILRHLRDVRRQL